MTEAFTTQTSAALGADKIARTATATALYENPIAIAKRGAGAPLVQVPERLYLTSGTSVAWPTYATAVTCYIIGAGGEGATGASASGNDGGDTTLTYNSVTYTANGGSGGSSGYTGGAGGTGTHGGDFATDGNPGGAGSASSTGVGVGGVGPMFGAGSYGAGGEGLVSSSNAGSGGGSGQLVIKRLVKVDGANTITYAIGVGGTGGSAPNGKPGLIVIEY